MGVTNALALSEAWRAWVAENLLRGVATSDVVRHLTANGVPARFAAREVDAMVKHPLFAVAHAIARRERRVALACELRAEVERVAHAVLPNGARDVSDGSDLTPLLERRAMPPATEFFTRYFATSTPVVLTDAMKAWHALEKWTPEWFKETLGDVVVELTSGRDADPDFDMNFKAHSISTPLADYIDRVRAAGPTNDFYMVANNRTLERSAMSVLFDDLRLDAEMFDASRLRGGSSLWIGPAGTKTPLHHDTTNILFCQVYGRKTVRLASPLDPAFMSHIRGVYSDVDFDRPASERVRADAEPTFEVTLGPGEALFIPVGWWHDVRALDVSISLSLTCFRRPNAFEWYVPGSCP